MIRGKPDRNQFLIDMAFGAALVAPIVYTAVSGDLRGSYVAVGISIGYVLHVLQKILMFSKMLQDAVKEEAKDRVQKEAEERVGEQVEKEVEEKIEKVNGHSS